jgi:hypothetical protein
MSGIVSGLTKIFTPVVSGIAKVGKSIIGVGATLFTGGAASGGAIGNVVSSVTGGGVLGNILTGAIKQAGIGALIGGAVGAMTGTGFGKGALYGALGGAVTGGLSGSGLFSAAGLTPADTPTGVAPTGSSAGSGAAAAAARAPAVAAAHTGSGGGLLSFLGTEAGAGLLAGAGEGLMGYATMKADEKAKEADRQFLLDKEDRLRRSYDVAPEALPGGGTMPALPVTQRPTPAQKYARTRYAYNSSTKQIEMVPA